MEQNKVVLGYWPIRGLAQRLRYLLEYTGQAYEDKVYLDRSEWFEKDKKNLGLDFPNLPYLIDGDFKITETSAIQEYIIKKSGKTELLGGDNLQNRSKVAMLVSLVNDLQSAISKLVYNQDFDNLRPTYYDENFKAKFQNFANFLGDKKFLTGELSLADFLLYEYALEVSLIYPEEFNSQFPTLVSYIKNFEEIPQIKAYIASERFIKAPWNSTLYAKWTGL